MTARHIVATALAAATVGAGMAACGTTSNSSPAQPTTSQTAQQIKIHQDLAKDPGVITEECSVVSTLGVKTAHGIWDADYANTIANSVPNAPNADQVFYAILLQCK